MKLFIWENVLCDYTCGIMLSLAETADEARDLLLAQAKQTGDCLPVNDVQQEPMVYDVHDPMARFVWGGG